MDSSPSIPSESRALPEGCRILGGSCAEARLVQRLSPWRSAGQAWDLLVLLAATRTAEHPGISAAGATPESRRFTALADAELLLEGPGGKRRWPLPPLPAGVTPALLSHVALGLLPLSPLLAAVGLEHPAPFPHLRLEPPGVGPADCLSGGKAMSPARVERLWRQGMHLGARLRRPVLLTECVPGGTTTAQAVLTALGISAGALISGSARQPPQTLKRMLVEQGLQRAALPERPSPEAVLAAVGDPFQVVAAGFLVAARQPVLLGGGSQMAAVLALALSALDRTERDALSDRVLLGTTAWLAEERLGPEHQPALGILLDRIGRHFDVSLTGAASGIRFHNSRIQALRDYERGFVKEGVGAGALLLLAQLQGHSSSALVQACELAVDQLQASP